MTTVRHHTDELIADPAGRAGPVPRAGGTQERAAGARGVRAGRAGTEAATDRPDPGLVIYPKTPRVGGSDSPAVPDSLSDLRLWSPGFPTAQGLSSTAKNLPMRDPWQGSEGPRPRIMISAGCITVSRPDLARHERTRERERARAQKRTDELAAHFAQYGTWPDDPEPSRVITAWSSKSRSNMVHTLCSLDFSPMLCDPARLPGMITLTYPGDWLCVAPTGKHVKRHLEAFKLRYLRAWGEPLMGLWKLEFQRRGAPHFHLLAVPPHGLAGTARQASTRARSALGDGMPFRPWLSAVWADIVAHPDPVQRMRHEIAGTAVDYAEGMRASDPKRVAVYFLKHSAPGETSKEYQHIVPEPWREPGRGPGRFWGYWQLDRVSVGAEVAPVDAIRAARILRRWAAAQGTTRQVMVERVRGGKITAWNRRDVIGLAGAGMVESRRAQRRRVRRPVRRLSGGTGWVAVNDGASFGTQLGRALTAWSS